MLQPPFFWKNVFFNLGFLKPKTMMLNKKHNSKSGRNKDKEKRFQRENMTGKPKKENILMKKRNSNLIFSCCSFQETKAQKIEQKKKRQKQERKESQKRKTRRKKERQEQNRETEKEKVKKGEAKKG